MLAAALGQRRESIPQPSGRRRSWRWRGLSRGRRGWGGEGKGLRQDGGQGGDGAATATAVAVVSARLAAPTEVPRWGRAPGPCPAPQARGAPATTLRQLPVSRPRHPKPRPLGPRLVGVPPRALRAHAAGAASRPGKGRHGPGGSGPAPAIRLLPLGRPGQVGPGGKPRLGE